LATGQRDFFLKKKDIKFFKKKPYYILMMGQENYSQSTYRTNLVIFGYLKKIPSKYDNFEPFFFPKKLFIQITTPSSSSSFVTK
jgi:hypothetical protein